MTAAKPRRAPKPPERLTLYQSSSDNMFICNYPGRHPAEYILASAVEAHERVLWEALRAIAIAARMRTRTFAEAGKIAEAALATAGGGK